MSDPIHRAGVIALLGRPNAGKSTLLNRLLGSKLAIVSAKPQTTRSRLLGILTLPSAQLLLVDTPGFHPGEKKPLNVALNDIVDEVAGRCDVAMLLVDLTRGWDEAHGALLAGLAARGKPFLLVGTKADLAGAESVDWPQGTRSPVVVSARTGAGIDRLLERLVELLPESPRLFPGDEISDRPMRFLAAELVREAAFGALDQELPYALAVEVEEYDEKRAGAVRIRANLLVERTSQKQIVIGREGRVIKRIGIRARREIEKLVGEKVHLELWVKVEPKWSRRPNRLKSLGYT